MKTLASYTLTPIYNRHNFAETAAWGIEVNDDNYNEVVAAIDAEEANATTYQVKKANGERYWTIDNSSLGTYPSDLYDMTDEFDDDDVVFDKNWKRTFEQMILDGFRYDNQLSEEVCNVDNFLDFCDEADEIIEDYEPFSELDQELNRLRSIYEDLEDAQWEDEFGEYCYHTCTKEFYHKHTTSYNYDSTQHGIVIVVEA